MSYKIAIIYGSVRSNRDGINAVKFIEHQLENRGHSTHIIDPMVYQLPFLDKMYKEFEPGEAPQDMHSVGQILISCDAYIIVTGEYNHGIPPALKNLLDHYQSEYFYKPSAIVSYSAGDFGGVRTAVHMRSVVAELGMSSIPSMFPIPRIAQAFDKSGVAQDEKYIRRAGRFLDELDWYTEALKTQREKGKS